VAAPGAITVLGIDPGLSVTGYGIVEAEGQAFRCLASGVIAPPPSASRPERLHEIHGALTDIVREWWPAEVAIEDFITGHVRAAVAIGEARAMAVLVAAQAGLPVFLYKPGEVKQFVTSYGRGSKAQVQAMVQALLGLDAPPAPADAADALAVALCHCLRRAPVLAGSAPGPAGRRKAGR